MGISTDNNNADSERVIDAEGYRPNVGIVIANAAGQLMWGRRIGGRDSWQFPQGGVHGGESPEQAMFRELDEEVGLAPEHVKILARTRGWLKYRLPSRYIRRHERPVCIGQKQKWFLLQLTAPESAIRLDAHDHPEFDHWRWVNYWYPISGVIDFKREVYRSALSELLPALAPRKRKPRRGGKARHRKPVEGAPRA